MKAKGTWTLSTKKIGRVTHAWYATFVPAKGVEGHYRNEAKGQTTPDAEAALRQARKFADQVDYDTHRVNETIRKEK